MIKIIFAILAVPFMPVLFWHDLANDISSKNIYGMLSSENRTKVERVLGQEDMNKKPFAGDPDCPAGNSLLSDNVYASGFLPVKKDDYQNLKLWAGSSVAIDVDSGAVLHFDNAKKRTQIASLTKMMTAILVIENIKDLDKEAVAIPTEALYIPGTIVGCPRTGFCPSNRLYAGEKVYAIDLLKAMLMNSANNAAYSLAVHIAGSEDKFVDMMNEKAKELGLTDTHFCTASGLEIDGQENECYSSAYDIAKIGSASLGYDLIWNIMKIPEGQFYSTDGKFMHVLKNTDLLLGTTPNCLGGKTGFTPMAGKSLLLGLTDAGQKHRVISVLLNDENRWEDMRILNSWIFSNYEWK
jgi:D-alanyl-D-alanine carboxypeptidase (penicillin-binding protein 5/6)